MLPTASLRLFCAGCLLLASLMLVACSSSKPEVTAEAFFLAIADREMDKVVEMCTFDVANNQMLKGKVKMAVDRTADYMEVNEGLRRVEILGSNIDKSEKHANIRVKLIFNNGKDHTEFISLRSEDGKWKVAI